jgi:hypothetical protein
MLPELAGAFAENEPLTPNLAFFSILPFVRGAHKRGDEDALRRAYAFAQWCHHQRRGSSLWNAAAVSFYEHLFDDWSIREDVASWLSPTVRRDIMPLWESRLSPAKVAALQELLAGPQPERWRELRPLSAAYQQPPLRG